MNFNKKASLEISIQAIVIVVLAMTLLGLGLGFIREMFTDITKTSTKVSAQVRDSIVDQLITGDKKLSFPETKITANKGASELLTIGIRNKGNDPLDYKVRFCAISEPDGTPLTCSGLDSWFQIATPQSGHWTLAAADIDVRNININVPKDVDSGVYVFTFDVLNTAVPPTDPNYIYAQKDVFIDVIG